MRGLHEEPIADYVDVGKFIAEVFEIARPPSSVLVSDAAEANLEINSPGQYVGRWRNDQAPYLVEPQNAFLERGLRTIIFVAASQTGKTRVPLNVIGYTAKHNPLKSLFFLPTERLALDFSKRQVERQLIEPSAAIRAELMTGRGSDTRYEKAFRNGASVGLGWPTATEFSSKQVPWVFLDEFDNMPADVGGEGSPVELARGRTTTFGRLAKVYASSSPKLPRNRGIMALFDEGTRCLWFWACPHCGERFSPGFDVARKPDPSLFRYPAAAGDDEIREAATLHCPHCGAGITEADKYQLNLAGVWLGQGQHMNSAGEISGSRRNVSTGSYWLSGLASNFMSFGELALRHVAAVRKFEREHDDTALKTVMNTGFGFTYASRVDVVEPPAPEILAGRADGYVRGEAPAGAVCVVAAADVQFNRFEAGFLAFGEGLESWWLDRFAILEHEGREVRPADGVACWQALLDRVMLRRFPIAGDPDRELQVMTTAIDTGGLEGVSDNARSFWYLARKAGISKGGITLVKGGKDAEGAILRGPTWLDKDEADKPNHDGPSLWLPNTSRMKAIIYTRLALEGDGPGRMHFPSDFEPRHLAELTAERREAGRWIASGANETLDLAVYCDAALRRNGGERSSLEWVPAWARPRPIDAEQAAKSKPARRRGVYGGVRI